MVVVKKSFLIIFFSFKRSFLMSIWTITTQLLLVNPIFFVCFGYIIYVVNDHIKQKALMDNKNENMA